MRPEVISRKVRSRHFYEVPKAGAKIGLKRSGSHAAIRAGVIPTVRDGKFLLVRRAKWDREVKRLLRGPQTKPPRTREARP